MMWCVLNSLQIQFSGLPFFNMNGFILTCQCGMSENGEKCEHDMTGNNVHSNGNEVKECIECIR